MYLDKYKIIRYNFFKWIYELDVVYKILLAFSFACLTGVLAQFRFYIPGTLVPVTGQVFGVLFAGVILGRWGGISQVMYLGVGAMGVPWFQGFNSGLAYMAGSTGGYLAGFVLAAFFIGFIVEKYVRSRSLFGMLTLMFFATFVLIYIPGLTYYYIWSGASLGLMELLTYCVMPFIAADIVKAIIAAGLASMIIPKKTYSN